MDKTKLTPPEIARLWGVGRDKVLAWIRSGELRAINVATHRRQRPRYLIDVCDLADFENRRSAAPPPRPTRRSRRRGPEFVIEYF